MINDHSYIIAPNFTKYSDDELRQIFSSSSSDSESSDETDSKCSIDDEIQKIKMMHNVEFKRYFRMNKATVQELIGKFKEDQPQDEDTKESHLSVDSQIYMTISYLTRRESYRGIAERYAVNILTFWSTINKIISWIIRQPYISWPNHKEQQITMKCIESETGVPFVIGAIGVTHIFTPGKGREEQYRSRQGNYSFVLQGVADHRNRFIDIHCGEPGGMDDYTILRKSTLYKNLFIIPHAINPNGFIAGSMSYPSSQWIVSPFRGPHQTNLQRLFNQILSKPMNKIIHAFAELKTRFQRLSSYVECGAFSYVHQDIEFLIQSVVACCMLHNFCAERDDHVDIVYTEREWDICRDVIDQGARRQSIFEYIQMKGVI